MREPSLLLKTVVVVVLVTVFYRSSTRNRSSENQVVHQWFYQSSTTNHVPLRGRKQGVSVSHVELPPTLQCSASGYPIVPHPLTRRLKFRTPQDDLYKLQTAINLTVPPVEGKVIPGMMNMYALRYAPHVLLVDENGKIVASKTLPTPKTTLVAPKWINSTTIVAIWKEWAYGPPGSAVKTIPVLYNWATDTLEFIENWGAKFLHHDIDFNPRTDSFLCLQRNMTDPPYIGLMDHIWEVTRHGELRWHWDSNKAIPFNNASWTPGGKWPNSDCSDFGVRPCKDWLHGNTIFWDSSRRAVYYNAKHQDSFYFLDMVTGQIKWSVGRWGGFKLFDRFGRRQPALWYKAHGVERIGENRFLMFDNDYWNLTKPEDTRNKIESARSRALEILVDPQQMTAREVWSWTSPEDHHAHNMGDADRLPNGNTVLSFTNSGHMTEVTHDGEIVWELSYPNPTQRTVVYHFEKWMWRPLVLLAAPMDGTHNTVLVDMQHVASASIKLRLFNNIRARYISKGKLTGWVDGQQVGRQVVDFQPNWIPTEVDFPVSKELIRIGGSVPLLLQVENAEQGVGCSLFEVKRSG